MRVAGRLRLSKDDNFPVMLIAVTESTPWESSGAAGSTSDGSTFTALAISATIHSRISRGRRASRRRVKFQTATGAWVCRSSSVWFRYSARAVVRLSFPLVVRGKAASREQDDIVRRHFVLSDDGGTNAAVTIAAGSSDFAYFAARGAGIFPPHFGQTINRSTLLQHQIEKVATANGDRWISGFHRSLQVHGEQIALRR